MAAWDVTVVLFTAAPALVAPLLAPAAALPAMTAASAVDLPALAPCAAPAAIDVPTVVAVIPEEPADATTPEVAPVAAEPEAAVAIA